MLHCQSLPYAGALSATRRVMWPAVLLACLSLALWVRPASANAAPPSPRMWFQLAYGEKRPGALQGAQLARCTGSDCANQELLQQYGRCDGMGCVAGLPPAASFSERFECAQDTCLSAWGYQHSPDAGTNLQLILQYPDGVRTSQPFAAPQLNAGMSTYNWLVQITDQGLSVSAASRTVQSISGRSVAGMCQVAIRAGPSSARRKAAKRF